MKLWKKIGSAIGLGLGYLLLAGQTIPNVLPNAIGKPTNIKFDTLDQAIQSVLNILVLVAGVVLLIMLFIGGIQYLTSGGNEEQSTKAKNLLRDAIIGIVIVAIAWALARFIVNALFRGITGPSLPLQLP